MTRNIFTIIIVCMVFLSCKQDVKKDEIDKTTTDKSAVEPRIVIDAVLAGGELQRIDSFPSQHIAPRPIDIWLPEGYSSDKKYSVLYMHDGQNLFDATTTWNKQEWKVDELVTELQQSDSIQDLIVVGIHNIPNLRFLDYYPAKSLDYLSQSVKDSLFDDAKKQEVTISFEDFKGDAYLKFMVDELKPYIDKMYATATEPSNTFVAGASMGGLISMYAMCEYPNVFGGAACISTHWPGMNPTDQINSISVAILKYMEANLPAPETHKFYFDYGTETLDAYYPKYLGDIDRIFYKKGYTSDSYINLEFEGADHSEDSWNRRFDIPLTFLFKK